MLWLTAPVTGFALLGAVTAQQVEGFYYPYHLLGLSNECVETLNTTISSCSQVLGQQADLDSGAVRVLGASDLNELCTTACFDGLKILKTKIQSTCSKHDVMVKNDVAYPATYMADFYLYTLSLSCRRDFTSNEFCDILGAEAETKADASFSCSDCVLGSWKIQLESPFGYDDSLASDFSSQTSSCHATGYAFTTPTAYALNTTASPAPTPICQRPYTVLATDTCASIAQANKVATFGVVSLNNLGTGCEALAEDKTLCLPETCSLRTITRDDECGQVAKDANTTIPRLIAWNPMLNPECSNFLDYIGYHICISTPGGDAKPIEGEIATTPVPVPTNANGEPQTNCAKWYVVQAGDGCADISVANGISLVDFYFINSGVNKDCTNLWLGYAYCVKPVGNIQTYTGYPVTVPSTSFTRPPTPTETSPTETFVLPTPTYAPGTYDNCTHYSRGMPASWSDAAKLNSCSFIAHINGVTVSQLLQWNPSLSKDSCTLSRELHYCVSMGQPVSEPIDYDGTPCMNIQDKDIVPGTISNCNCFSYVSGGLTKSYTTCEDIASEFHYDVGYLVELNPWLTKANCTEELLAGLSGPYDLRYFCISNSGDPLNQSSSTGLPGITHTPSTAQTTVSSTSTSVSITTAPTVTATSSGGPPAPTQDGAVSNCIKWHIVEAGDGCWAIYTKYGITSDQFFEWNTKISKDCSNIWLGYAVCVGV